MPSPEPGPPAHPGEPAGISIYPVSGLGEVVPGADLVDLLAGALDPSRPGGPALPGGLVDGDILVVTQKVVSKAEGRIVEIDASDPEAKQTLVEKESVRILRRRDELLITETRHGFVCANAGVDLPMSRPERQHCSHSTRTGRRAGSARVSSTATERPSG